MSQTKSEIWKRDMVYELISYFKFHEELWDVTNTKYINRIHKKNIYIELAQKLNVSPEEVSTKLHNLRCQFNGEIRKMSAKSKSGANKPYMSKWEYFPFLTFLLKEKGDLITSNIENSKSSQKPGTAKPKRSFLPSNIIRRPYRIKQCVPVVPVMTAVKKDRSITEFNDETASEIKEEPQNYDDQSQNDFDDHIIPNDVQPMFQKDSCQIFGDFVADSLRNLNEHKRKKLKIQIQKAILEVEEEDDRIDCFQVIEKFEINE